MEGMRKQRGRNQGVVSRTMLTVLTMLAPYGCRQAVLTSAEKGDGIEELRACLEAAVSEA